MISRVLLFAALGLPASVGAQIRASELASMSQVIDGTKITVEYSRPRARGRETLFGTKAVQWDEVWTPGANYATTFEVDRNVKVGGKSVAKGKYSVWLVVRKSGPWTFVLDPNHKQYHMAHPDSNASQIRIPVQPETVPFTDVLTWSMPALRIDGGTLAMQWERVRVPVDITVEPSLVTTFPADKATAYLGEYLFTEADSTGKPTTKTQIVTVTHEDGTLKARFTPEDPYMKKFALVSIAPDWFAPGIYDEKGVLYEIMKPDFVVEFTRQNGRAVSFVIRAMDDSVWGRAVLKR
jgi:hypothetical protein